MRYALFDKDTKDTMEQNADIVKTIILSALVKEGLITEEKAD